MNTRSHTISMQSVSTYATTAFVAFRANDFDLRGDTKTIARIRARMALRATSSFEFRQTLSIECAFELRAVTFERRRNQRADLEKFREQRPASYGVLAIDRLSCRASNSNWCVRVFLFNPLYKPARLDRSHRQCALAGNTQNLKRRG